MSTDADLLAGIEWFDRETGLALRPGTGEVFSLPYWRTEASRS